MTKIMLVEDDKSLREIYSIRLVAEGYNIVLADDGEEALAMAVQEKPDLIISDVMMPKISGFDMLDILRSTPETQNVKIIMMTALSGEDQRQRGENLGADRYLVKSQVGIEDVVATVHEVLGDSANTSAQTNLGMVASTMANATAAQNYIDQVAAGVAATPNANQTPAEPAGRMVTQAPSMAGAASATTAGASVMPAGAEGFESGQSLGGERVIQPINDPRLDQARAEMQRKMEEALNDGNGMMGSVDMSEIDKPPMPQAAPQATTTQMPVAPVPTPVAPVAMPEAAPVAPVSPISANPVAASPVVAPSAAPNPVVAQPPTTPVTSAPATPQVSTMPVVPAPVVSPQAAAPIQAAAAQGQVAPAMPVAPQTPAAPTAPAQGQMAPQQ